MNAERSLVVQRWQQRFGAWLAVTMLVSALLVPLFSVEPAIAKSGGKHHSGGHHGKVHHGKEHQAKKNGGGTHCTGELVDGELQNESCYRTFSLAISAATAGRVHLSSDVSPANLTEQDLEQGLGSEIGTQSYNQTVLGIFYDLTNFQSYGGSTYIVWTSNLKGCTDGSVHYLNTMPTVGTFSWDNKLSSARTYSGCKARYYMNPYRDASYKYITRSDDVADFGGQYGTFADNAVSSVEWTRA